MSGQVDLELRQLLLIVKGAEMLGWVITPGRRAEMVAEVRKFLAADIKTRKQWFDATFCHLFVFGLMVQTLKQSDSHEADESVVPTLLALAIPHERPPHML